VRERGPPSEAETIVLVIEGRLARERIPGLCEEVLARLEEAGNGDLVICDVSGVVDPDAVTVDALARLQLTVRRAGREVRLRDPCAELEDLLDLVGLSEVLPVVAELRVEVRGQAPEREQPLGAEEERDPADPAL
jgi:ABC-type transporter Mla MlaB component